MIGGLPVSGDRRTMRRFEFSSASPGSSMFRPLVTLAFAAIVSATVPQSFLSSTMANEMTGPNDPDATVQPGKVDADAPTEYTETDSGLKYRILRKGDGQKPTARDTVSAHYKGYLDNGTIFDSSYRRGEPTSFPLNRVIPGWTEGLQLVGEGGMIDLEIPSDLGYGAQGIPGTIPGGATLHFLVELVEVK